MKQDITSQFVPQQYTGNQSEASAYVIAANEEDAKDIFFLAKQRLLDVNHWNVLCGFLSTAFQLADAGGFDIERTPLLADYIRVGIPGPGISIGGGYDWVRIERLTHIHIDAHQELFFIQVRPASHPGYDYSQVAHFFKNSATTSFMIVRELMQVTAAIYGRNEVPNTETGNPLDNIRNQVIGSSGAIGLSALQWRSLVTGLLSPQI